MDANAIEWRSVYWMRGQPPRGARYDVKDPPCTGWQGAVLIRGQKRSTLFCPHTMQIWQVRSDAAEIVKSKPRALDKQWLGDTIERNWKDMQARGWVRDYDFAAGILKAFGRAVPEEIDRSGERSTVKTGGRSVGEELKKPVKFTSKRGKFLLWFLEGGGTRGIREAMAEFDMTRSNALSYLFMLQKDHGIGYDLIGGAAIVTLPDGCTNPFDIEWGDTNNSDDDLDGLDDDWDDWSIEEDDWKVE